MTPRRTLWRKGQRGDIVKVVLDPKQGYCIVHYKDADKRPRKKFFPNTKEGRDSAVAWAETYWTTRHEIAARRKAAPDLTLRALWEAYTASPTYLQLRPATRINYTARWRKWELFMGAEAKAEDTTLLHVDQFLARAIEAGTSRNQARQVINVARVVYRYGETREMLVRNRLHLYRWSEPKDELQPLEPGEFLIGEWEKILAQLSPQSGGRWRAHVAILLAGSHAVRANAVRHLRWSDISGGNIIWPGKWQKNGKEHVQPLTWDAVSALETARYWRQRSGYTGPWVLYAGGGRKKLGPVVLGSKRGYRKGRTPEQDTPITYQALWVALRKAEERAGLEHEPYKALHGFRRGAAGNMAEQTGDARLAMEWLNDSVQQADGYLKRREERMRRAAAAADESGRKGEP